MSNATITRLQGERETQTTFISELLASVESEGRDLVDAERQNIAHAETRMAEIDAQLEPLVKFEARRAAAVVVSEAATGRPRRPAGELSVVENRSLGAIYTESEEFRSYSGRGSSGIVHIPGFGGLAEHRATTVTNATPGSVLMPKADKYFVPEHYGAMPLLSLVSAIEVSSNAVEIVTIGDADTGAAVVAEGAQKPEVNWTASSATVTLQTVAGWHKFSRQSLADIPQLRSLIDQKIRRSIDLRLNTLATTALTSAFTGANTTTGAAGVKMLELIRGAIASLQGRGIYPTAVALNPADYAKIDIELMGKPLGGAVINGSFWSLTPVPVAAVPANHAYIGDIGEALAWFYKDGLDMFTTDSDISGAGATAASDFRANILTTLGEVRGIFAVTDASVLQRVIVTP